ncbi:MAG: FeS assembly ATPase SufC [Parcubacteria group bacterium GW2011_GWA1_47_8]|nr:MAG: FeS assembly ATPase SufC [Parcubacteria group bacterium GW2011_GWA1_47_8]
MSTLTFKNITVRREGKTIVDDASLELASGEVHLIMGPNGSGKSTLLNAVMGHPAYEMTGGSVVLDDEDITNLPTEKKAGKGVFLSMQYLPAVDGVTMLTLLHRAYRMIKGGLPAKFSSVEESVGSKNTRKFLSGESSAGDISIPEFYKMLSAKVKEFNFDEGLLKRFVNKGFSGGEKKQGEMIQLLALEPKFALLDEIDSGVDIDSLVNVFAGIEKLRKEGTGFLIVTHLGTILEKINPDRVSVMKEGRVVKTGGPELAREIIEKGFNG